MRSAWPPAVLCLKLYFRIQPEVDIFRQGGMRVEWDNWTLDASDMWDVEDDPDCLTLTAGMTAHCSSVLQPRSLVTLAAWSYIALPNI